jgi:hypothetical protein
MRAFFDTNHTDLQYAFWAFTGIAIVFGNKFFGGVLSRVPGLTRPGGFYSRLLMVTVVVCITSALNYALDRFTNHLILYAVQTAVHLPVSEAQYAVGLAVPTALLFFTYPGLGRPGNKAPKAPDGAPIDANVPLPFQMLGAALLFAGNYAASVLSLLLARHYLFTILHWFVGRPYPNDTILFIAALVPPVTTVTGRWLQRTSKRFEADEGSMALVVVAMVGILLVIPLFLFCLALGLANVGFSVYLGRQIGWAAAVYVGLSFVAGSLASVLGLWADSLDSKKLEGFYTLVPGGLAALIQLGLQYPNLLPN